MKLFFPLPSPQPRFLLSTNVEITLQKQFIFIKMDCLESFELASKRVKDDFEKVKRESTRLLLSRGFTVLQAEQEEDNFILMALFKTLGQLMDDSSRKAVQPDYLIVHTSFNMWLEACEYSQSTPSPSSSFTCIFVKPQFAPEQSLDFVLIIAF